MELEGDDKIVSVALVEAAASDDAPAPSDEPPASPENPGGTE
jgi:hypothetical protein